MEILVSNSDTRPIYEQIAEQIKTQIMTGALSAGEALPSIRQLARDLRISVITTKRAYEELERDGFIHTAAGKGSFVAEKNSDFLREERLRIAEQHLAKAVQAGKTAGIGCDELQEILKLLYESE